MGQVSRPLQILLVAVLLFGAVYMLALRPKNDGGGSHDVRQARAAGLDVARARPGQLDPRRPR